MPRLLQALYDYFRDRGVYDLDQVDRLGWLCLLVLVVSLVLNALF